MADLDEDRELLSAHGEAGVLARAIAGDRAAQEVILRDNYAYVRRLLHRLVGPTPELEDLQQTVLMRIVTSLPRLREEESLSTFIGGICVHVARDHIRRRKVRSVVALDVREEQTRSANPVRRLEAREGLRRCRSALDALSANHRVALTLKIMGYSVDEIAAMMGSARSTTRLRLYYARKAFSRAVEHEADAGPALLSEAEDT